MSPTSASVSQFRVRRGQLKQALAVTHGPVGGAGDQCNGFIGQAGAFAGYHFKERGQVSTLAQIEPLTWTIRSPVLSGFPWWRI